MADRRIQLAILAILAAIATAMGLNVDEILEPYSDVLTPSPAVSATFDDAATLTADWHDISTLVATFTWTETPRPSATVVPTNTRRPTSTTVPLSPVPTATRPTIVVMTPTQEVWTVTPVPSDLPPLTYFENVSASYRNIRECPALNCEKTGILVAPGETIVLDVTFSVISDGLKWYPLWNRSGWVATETTDVPPTVYLRIRP